MVPFAIYLSFFISTMRNSNLKIKFSKSQYLDQVLPLFFIFHHFLTISDVFFIPLNDHMNLKFLLYIFQTQRIRFLKKKFYKVNTLTVFMGLFCILDRTLCCYKHIHCPYMIYAEIYYLHNKIYIFIFLLQKPHINSTFRS